MSLMIIALVASVLVVVVLSALVTGLFNTGVRVHVLPELRYRYVKWRINRMHRPFELHSGSRAEDVDRRVR